jgi:hypothetical protein
LFDLINIYIIPIYIISGEVEEIIEESMNFAIPQYKELKEKNRFI